MKAFLILLSAIFAGTFLDGCKKSAKSVAPPESNWTWSLSTTKFVGTSTYFDGGTLKSYDDPDMPVHYLFIYFSARPDSNTSYPVVNILPFGSATPACNIGFFTSGRLQLEASGGGVVNVTMVAGKIHATFTDIPMGVSNSNVPGIDPDGTLSGTLIEQ